MTAALPVLEPIFEADLPSEIYAYRAGRNAQQAVVEVEELVFRGHPDVVDADLADYDERGVETEPRSDQWSTARRKGAATDMLDLPPLRHTPNLPRAAVVARLMYARLACPQLRKCRVRSGSYAWGHLRTFSHQQAAEKCPLRVKTVVPAAAKRGTGIHKPLQLIRYHSWLWGGLPLSR